MAATTSSGTYQEYLKNIQVRWLMPSSRDNTKEAGSFNALSKTYSIEKARVKLGRDLYTNNEKLLL
ncbi:hypothetical protein E4U55_003182 [Claviceps digitariae]|nr:hypothetical protein E4U55_003182 [Claviceps digitariae]